MRFKPVPPTPRVSSFAMRLEKGTVDLAIQVGGQIVDIPIAKGQPIAQGTTIAVLHLEPFEIALDQARVQYDQADRTLAQLLGSDARYPLQTREFNAETSQVGQTFQITLAMDPPDDLLVFPGAFVTVYATLRWGQDAGRIPQSAVITSTDGTTQVMGFSSQDGTTGTVSAAPVAIEPAPNGDILVLEDLESGQEIVASGVHLLSDGDAVTRFTGFAN